MQRAELLDSYYDEVVTAIAGDRGIEVSQLLDVIEQGVVLPNEAKKLGLVDRILYGDEIEGTLRNTYGSDLTLGTLFDDSTTRHERWQKPSIVAVVAVDGMIVDGESQRSPLLGGLTAGSTTIIRSLEALGDDPDVRAVVVRIDSPGGSASASDNIFRALRQLSQKKPVVASMGNVATSGGYYVAAGADRIFAYPTTVTGSIGIFTGKFSVQELSLIHI